MSTTEPTEKRPGPAPEPQAEVHRSILKVPKQRSNDGLSALENHAEQATRTATRSRIGSAQAAVAATACGLVLGLAPSTPAQAHSSSALQHVGIAAQSAPERSGRWSPLAAIASGPRQEHSVAAIGRDVYVVGGNRPGVGGTFPTVGDVEVYDTRQDTWRAAAPLPTVINHPNLAAVRGKLYVLGGLAEGESWHATGLSYVYNPRTDRWRRLPSMPAGSERGSSAVGVRGNTIVLAGGMRTLVPAPGGLQDSVATVSSFNVKTRQWRSLPDLPQARDHVGGAFVGNTFYALGGRDRGQANVRGTVYALNMRTLRWRTRAPMPTPRGGIASAVIGSRIYTFGGEGNADPASNGVFADTEVYDAATNRWRRMAPMAAPRHGTAAVAVGNRIHIPGGANAAGGAPVDTNDAFRPSGR